MKKIKNDLLNILILYNYERNHTIGEETNYHY